MRLKQVPVDFEAEFDSEGRIWCTCTLCKQNKDGGRYVNERTRRKHLEKERAPAAAVSSHARTSAAGALVEREIPNAETELRVPAGRSEANQANLLAGNVEFEGEGGLDGAEPGTRAEAAHARREGGRNGTERAGIGSWFGQLPDFEAPAVDDDREHGQGEDPGQAGGPGSALEEKLLDAIVDLQRIGEQSALSNAVMDKLLKTCIGASDSFAAAIDPRWKETITRLALPQSHAQVTAYLARSSRELGEAQNWRWHPGPKTGENKGHWHLFAPSAEDCRTTPCPECEEGPRRPAWRDCPVHQEKCPDCGFRRRDAYELPYISPELHARAKLTTLEGCKDATVRGAWGQREHWLGQPKGGVFEPQSEVWDGERWRDDAAFFDPESSFLLPLTCPECCRSRKVHCAKTFSPPWFTRPTLQMWVAERQRFEALCPICKTEMTATLSDLARRGDPRNLKLGLHQDGFPTATTSSKSSCILDVFPMTVSKRNLHRGTEDWLWPLMLPQKTKMVAGPDCYDPFMLAFVLDALRLFKEGILVNYALPPNEISPKLPPQNGPVRIRMIVSSVFSDLPALADMLKFKLGGYWVSRSCKHQATRYNDGRLVYQDGRRLARDGCEEKTMEDVAAAMLEHLGARSKAERNRINKRTGFNGFCMLLILWAAYGLHLLLDICSDFLHCGPENMVKHLLQDFLNGVTSKQGDTTFSLEPPRADKEDFGKRLAGIRPTRKLGDGRWPADPEKRPLGWWKAEEHMKAATVCFATAFADVATEDPEGYAIVQLVACIHTLVYLVGTRGGWTSKLACVFQQLLKAKLVRAEEYALPKLRPLDHETCLHMPTNVRMHGPPDAYWCYAQERKIKQLVNTKHNCKEVESTLHKRALFCVRIAWLLRKRREERLRAAGRSAGDDVWARARARESDGVVFAASQTEAATYVEQLGLERPRDARASDEQILARVREEGVAVGQLPEKWETRTRLRLENVQRVAVERIFDGEARAAARTGERYYRVDRRTVRRARSIQLGENNFAPGDHAVLAPKAADESEEYVLVESFFTAKPKNGPRRIFLEYSRFRIQRDAETGLPLGGSPHNCLMLEPLKPGQKRVRLACHLRRHFIPVPALGETLCTGASHVIEVAPSGLGFEAHDVWVPVLPRVGDIVRVEVLEDADVRKEGVEGQWGYGVPYGVLKSVRPGWSLAYAIVRKVSSGGGRKAALQWLKRCGPPAPDGGEEDWTPYPVEGEMDVDSDAERDEESDAESDGEARAYELKTVTWNQIKDRVESVKMVEDRQRGQIYTFKALPPVRIRI